MITSNGIAIAKMQRLSVQLWLWVSEEFVDGEGVTTYDPPLTEDPAEWVLTLLPITEKQLSFIPQDLGYTLQDLRIFQTNKSQGTLTAKSLIKYLGSWYRVQNATGREYEAGYADFLAKKLPEDFSPL